MNRRMSPPAGASPASPPATAALATPLRLRPALRILPPASEPAAGVGAGGPPPAQASGTSGDDGLPCARCLRRAWLIARLAGHIENAWLARRSLPAVLALPDAQLIAGLAGKQRARIQREYFSFDARGARATCAAAAVGALCRCDPRYPAMLAELPDAPAVLFVHRDAGQLERCLAGDAVAVVGARRASPYGLEQARGLGRGLAAAGVTVVSGMALGIDAAAHAGALEVAGPTVAVLAVGPERAYPASKQRLHEQIAATGAIVSELPPGTTVRRWGFPARNRIIAALARVTVVVEATERSGSLITAGLAGDLGRDVAAVPGLVTSPLTQGTHGLIVDGARLVRGAEDVLELLFGAAAPAGDSQPAAGGADRGADSLPTDLRDLLDRIGSGRDTVAALTGGDLGLDAVLAGIAQLELRRLVRRTAGGRFVVVARSGR
jgi:DNA processing protein